MPAHTTVLLEETASALLQAPADLPRVFVDATFGRGGHSRYLLSQMSPVDTLIAVDKDPEAIESAHQLAMQDARLKPIHGSFAELNRSLAELGIDQLDGIMADLGVSSPQLDVAARGFSFQSAGPIDMRMDSSSGETAAQLIERLSEEELADVLYEYGDERHSRRLARAIKAAWPLASTTELAEVIKTAHPKWEKRIHPATKSFQALRIKVNNELGDLESLLEQSLSLLKTDAVLAVISFHSLEDRRVKHFMQKHASGALPEGDPWGAPLPKLLTKHKRIKASEAEIQNNPRARSAWLRVAARTQLALTEQKPRSDAESDASSKSAGVGIR